MDTGYKLYQIKASLSKKWSLEAASHFLNNIDEDLCPPDQLNKVRQTHHLLLSGLEKEAEYPPIIIYDYAKERNWIYDTKIENMVLYFRKGVGGSHLSARIRNSLCLHIVNALQSYQDYLNENRSNSNNLVWDDCWKRKSKTPYSPKYTVSLNKIASIIHNHLNQVLVEKYALDKPPFTLTKASITQTMKLIKSVNNSGNVKYEPHFNESKYLELIKTVI